MGSAMKAMKNTYGAFCYGIYVATHPSKWRHRAPPVQPITINFVRGTSDTDPIVLLFKPGETIDQVKETLCKEINRTNSEKVHWKKLHLHYKYELALWGKRWETITERGEYAGMKSYRNRRTLESYRI